MFSCEFVKFLRASFYRLPLMAASENLRDVFVQDFFSSQLKLCLLLIYFHSYSFAPSMAKMPSNIFFSNVSLNDTGHRKKCIMRKHSWNSEKPSSCSEVFCNGNRFSWKYGKISLSEPRFLIKYADWTTATLLRRDSGGFPRILRNSQEHLFYRKPLGYCFWKWPRRAFGILGKILVMRLF